MANYLQRVASSAARRAAIAKPPSSGPPLLPGGKELTLPAEGLFPSDTDQFPGASTHDERERLEASQPEEHEKITPSSKMEVEGDTRTTEPRDATNRRVEPETKPRTSQESLSSEPAFTVHLPKTLRPVSVAKVTPAAEEQPRDRAPASTDAGPTSSEPAVTRAPRPGVADTSAPAFSTRAQVAGLDDERQPPIKTAPAISETTPIPVLERNDGPKKIPPHRDEPVPPPALPVQLPPVVVGGAARQEQSRISIGSLEVVVNNQPPVTPARQPAITASRGEKLNLEKRYLDRFRLRH
jgi:hypothetical protein